METRVLDYVLVPSGLLLMVAYHIWLLHRILSRPNKTVIGINAISRRFWVRAMTEQRGIIFTANSGKVANMQDVSKNGVLAVQTLRNNIMASTLLASTAIMLSSLIAVLMTSSSLGQSPFLVFGDRSQMAFSVKFFAILVCFLLAFFLNVQSIRYYSHASILLNVPFKRVSTEYPHQPLTVEYVARTVNMGSYFWSLGLRAFYFSFPLFLWIFGPIPMVFSSFLLVFVLYFLDITSEFMRDGTSSDHNAQDEEADK